MHHRATTLLLNKLSQSNVLVAELSQGGVRAADVLASRTLGSGARSDPSVYSGKVASMSSSCNLTLCLYEATLKHLPSMLPNETRPVVQYFKRQSNRPIFVSPSASIAVVGICITARTIPRRRYSLKPNTTNLCVLSFDNPHAEQASSHASTQPVSVSIGSNVRFKF